MSEGGVGGSFPKNPKLIEERFGKLPYENLLASLPMELFRQAFKPFRSLYSKSCGFELSTRREKLTAEFTGNTSVFNPRVTQDFFRSVSFTWAHYQQFRDEVFGLV